MIEFVVQNIVDGDDCFIAEDGEVFSVTNGEVATAIESAKEGELLLIVKGRSCAATQAQFKRLIEHQVLVPRWNDNK